MSCEDRPSTSHAPRRAALAAEGPVGNALDRTGPREHGPRDSLSNALDGDPRHRHHTRPHDRRGRPDRDGGERERATAPGTRNAAGLREARAQLAALRARLERLAGPAGSSRRDDHPRQPEPDNPGSAA